MLEGLLLLLLASSDLSGRIDEYLRAPAGSEAEAAALEKVRVYWEQDREAVEEALRSGVTFPAAETGLRKVSFTLSGLDKDEAAPKTNGVAVWVPEGYDPAKRWPLLLLVHGTGGSAVAEVRELGHFADKHGILIVGPQDELNRGGGGWGYTDYEREIHVQGLRWAKGAFNVDDERVFVFGGSRGGHASWDLAYTWPDLFAGAIPVVGGPKLRYFRYLPNLKHVAVFDMQGAKDNPVLVEFVRDAVARLAEMKYDVTYEEDAASGHSFPIDWDGLAKWMGKRRRDSFPKEVVRVAVRDDRADAYWLRLSGLPTKRFAKVKPPTHDGSKPLTREEQKELVLANYAKYCAKVTGRIDGNEIHLTVKKAPKMVLRLSDRLLNLDERVTIYVNGRQRKRAKLSRSLDTLLRIVKETGDRAMLPTVEVTVRGVR